MKGPINGDIPRKQVTDLEHKLRQWQYCYYYYYQYYYYYYLLLLLLLLKYHEPGTTHTWFIKSSDQLFNVGILTIHLFVKAGFKFQRGSLT